MYISKFKHPRTPVSLTLGLLGLLGAASGCNADDGIDDDSETGETGDPGDGDGDPGDGDGDPGDGDGDPGDGDGDPGDGDGDPGDGDGDGDPGDGDPGDGDGDPDDSWEIVETHAGGLPVDAVIHGDWAFAAVGPRVLVYDLQDPASPATVAAIGPFDGLVQTVAADGERLYLAELRDLDGRVHAFDVSNPAAPAQLGQISYSDAIYRAPRDLYVDGDTLLIADAELGFFALDVSVWDAPVELGSFPQPGFSKLAVVGQRIYFGMQGWAGSAIGALDRDDYSVIGYSTVPTALAMEFSATDLVVIAGVDGTTVLDLSDPNLPVERYADQTGARTVAIAGDQALVPAADGLHALDLSVPESIVHAGPIAMPSDRASAVASDGAKALALSELGRGFSISLAQAQPELAAAFSLPGCASCKGAGVAGATLVVSDFYVGARYLDAAELWEAGRAEIGNPQVGAEDVAVDGFAYLADWASGLYIYDFSDPEQPVELSHLETGGYPSAVAVAGGLAFVGESTNGGGLRVIDVADPSAPVEIAALATAKVWDLALVGARVYVADQQLGNPGGLRIVDVADPSAPVVIGHYDVCTSSFGVAVREPLAAVACTDGLHLVDVSDPTAPTQVGVYQDPGAFGMGPVAFDADMVYVGHSGGVDFIEVSDPAAPVMVERRWTAAPVWSLDWTGPGQLAVSAGVAGLYHWALD